MGMEKEVVHAKVKNRWVRLSLEGIQESLKKIYKVTKKKDISLALMNVRDFYKEDEILQREAGFVSKLIQLEASGYIEPPVNIGRLYKEIVRSMSIESKNFI